MRITVTLRTDIEGRITEKTAEAELEDRRVWIGLPEDGEWRQDEGRSSALARALFESMSPQPWVINGPDGMPAATATAKEEPESATKNPQGLAGDPCYEAFRVFMKPDHMNNFYNLWETWRSAAQWAHERIQWERERNREARECKHLHVTKEDGTKFAYCSDCDARMLYNTLSRIWEPVKERA